MLKCPATLKNLNKKIFFSNFHFFRSNRFTKINKQKIYFALVAVTDYIDANCYVAGTKRRKFFLSNLNNAINTVSAVTAVQQKLIQSTNYGASFYNNFNSKTAATVVV